jgi:membrane-associated phospholipid phosphatase
MGPLGDLAGVLRTDGARHVLLAQVLWVFAYAPLPVFFILYAEDTLGMSVGTASILPAGFGVLTGLAVVAAGRATPERVFGLLVAGVALEGVGLGGAALSGSLAGAVVPFALAAVGLGLVTTLGFVYFARFVPEGKAGGYSGAYFATRAVAGAAALPLAGVLVEVTGTYRAVLLLGLAALPALVPLVLAERRRVAGAERVPRALPRLVTAVIPVHASYAFAGVARDALGHVRDVVLVNDGGPAGLSEAVCAFAAEQPRVQVLKLAENSGKGSAVAFAVERVLARDDPPDAILVLDSDGQHPPELIPRFLEASRTSAVVIGDRSRNRRGMPFDRRLANTVATAAISLLSRRRVRDSQNGMRLYRADALRRVPLRAGRYEAETEHLRRLLRVGESVAWVPIPTVYGGEPSSFRPLADTLRVAGAVMAPRGRGSGAGRARARAVVAVLDEWWLRLLAGLGAVLAIAAALPLLDGADAALFTSMNRLGDGPEWIYQMLDPHSRNYALIVAATAAVLAVGVARGRGRAGLVLGGAVAVTASAFLSDMFLEVFQLLADRPRPEEALGESVLLSHDRTWAHIPSYPSGHLIVTTAMVVTAAAVAPVLRPVLWLYVAAVAVTRVVFGAHFPLDVVVGIAFGYEAGLFSVALARATGLLPAWVTAGRPALPPLRPRRAPASP